MLGILSFIFLIPAGILYGRELFFLKKKDLDEESKLALAGIFCISMFFIAFVFYPVWI